MCDSQKDSVKQKDKWDILSSLGSFLIPVVVAIVGLVGSILLYSIKSDDLDQRRKQDLLETKVRLYTNLISNREEAEKSQAQAIFVNMTRHLLATPKTSRPLEDQVLKLELLSCNFHDSLNLGPLFREVLGTIERAEATKKISCNEALAYTERLRAAARSVAQQQKALLMNAGQKFDRSINFSRLDQVGEKGVHFKRYEVPPIESIQRYVDLSVYGYDKHAKVVEIKLVVITQKRNKAETIRRFKRKVGFFDFPIVNNFPLSDNQSCAVVLNEFSDDTADWTVLFFPHIVGTYGTIKDQIYFDRAIRSVFQTDSTSSHTIPGRQHVSAVSSSTPLVVAYIALGGVLVTAFVALIVGILANCAKKRDLKWKKEQWLKDKKESVYIECMKCLNESRILIVEDLDGRVGIEKDHFNGRMASLQFAFPWMTMVAAYSSVESATRIQEAGDALHRLIRKVQAADLVTLDVDRHDGTKTTLDGKLDEGLSAALENAITVVADCAKRELMNGIGENTDINDLAEDSLEHKDSSQAQPTATNQVRDGASELS